MDIVRARGRLTTDGGEDPDGGAGELVLVVEDDETAALELTRALREAGVDRVDVVETGVDAIGYFLQRPPDAPLPALVLLDFHLPDDSGRELLREFTTNPDLSDVPVVALRWHDDPDDHERAYELGASAYLTKPAAFDDLRAMVEGVVGFWLAAVAEAGNESDRSPT